jgi:hypothetical protein
MALDNNYSTINENNFYYNQVEGLSSRIIISIPYTKYDTGITGGDVIYFDNSNGPVNGVYRKSKADSPETAEVFGIVESCVGDTGNINVVISGSINLPTRNIFNTNNTSLNLGSNDVYFLSGETAGALENYPPTTTNYIIKPIYLNAPHGAFTGLVRNYVGYKNPSEFIFNPESVLFTFSEDMTKSLSYNEETKRFFVKSVSYLSDTFTQTETYSFDKPDLEIASSQNIDFLLNSEYDAKISDDGKHILLFGKPSKKIYYIYIKDQTDIQLKATIDVDLVGNPDDLIWAVDNEVTCFTVGTKCLDRAPDFYDTQINSYQLSSKIEYWKRNVNNSVNPFRWRRTFNQPAFGNLDSKPLSATNDGPNNDELYTDGGIHRLSDLKCYNKNFSLSCKTLIEDQINYKSKIAPIYAVRYENIIGIGKTLGYTYNDVAQLFLTDNIPSGPSLFFGPLFNTTLTYPNHTQQADNPQNKKYCCSFGVDQYRILNNYNNYYYEDQVYKRKNFAYDKPADGTVEYNLNFYNGVQGRTLNNSIKQLTQLTYTKELYEGILYSEALIATEFTLPAYHRNALNSKCCSTNNFSLYAFLYEYINNNNISKQLIICKYPINAYDNLNVFSYYHRSDLYKRVLPDDGSGYGYITSFRSSSIGPQITGQYVVTFNAENIPCIFSSENVISQINIDQLTNYSLFSSNDRFFIATPSKVIVWTFATASYNIINYTNLDKAIFFTNINGEFFKLNNKIFKYNTSTQFFDEQNI